MWRFAKVVRKNAMFILEIPRIGDSVLAGRSNRGVMVRKVDKPRNK
jgi:hypothetical protein